MKEIKPLTSKELRAWRVRRGLSQLAMSKLLGVRQATLSDWEKDISVTNEKILRVALLGLSRSMPLTHDDAGKRLPV